MRGEGGRHAPEGVVVLRREHHGPEGVRQGVVDHQLGMDTGVVQGAAEVDGARIDQPRR
jgi:hypothetical protein